jgi:hypothetical protein
LRRHGHDSTTRNIGSAFIEIRSIEICPKIIGSGKEIMCEVYEKEQFLF